MDIASTDQPTRQALAIEGRSGRLKVTGKLKVALDAMVWDGKTRDQAAEHARLSIHGLREALKRPHVKQYYSAQIEVLRENERARNIHALVQVRDQTGNQMARVQAVKALEQLSDEANRPGGNHAVQVPGLTIVIGSPAHPAIAPANPPMIDVSPNEVTHE